MGNVGQLKYLRLLSSAKFEMVCPIDYLTEHDNFWKRLGGCKKVSVQFIFHK